LYLHADQQRLADLETRVAGGRPIAQWPRLEAGRSDDLGTGKRRLEALSAQFNNRKYAFPRL
jgi:hypothetical protein